MKPPRTYWRTLDEAAASADFEEWLHREFPRGASEWSGALDRRAFLTLMGASVALAGLGGCAAPPQERIVPYVRAPEERIPGEPRWFATAFALDGIALGVLAESHQGRPVKIEGNPQHPASLGATDAFAQASVLELYDPDRAQTPTERGRIRTWPDVLSALSAMREKHQANGGAGFRLLTEPVTSPTLARQIEALLREWPDARWHQWQPVARGDTVDIGARLAFGEVVEPRYVLSEADVVVALDADLLGCTPRTLAYVRAFADRRSREGEASMIRLYAVESTLTLTGAAADHRLPVPSHAVEGIARGLARRLGLDVPAAAVPDAAQPWLDGLAGDLERHRGRSLVVAGDTQPPAVHALAHALNARLGNAGRTVVYTAPLEARPVDQTASLRALAADIAAGRVDTLVIVGGNPVYTAPADIDVGALVARVPTSLHLSVFADETSARCLWHVPAAHYLEAWSDTRAWNGAVSIVQPLVAPLYGGRSPHELLAALGGQPQASAHELVRTTWREAVQADDFERWWRGVLRTGVVPDTALGAQPVALRSDWAQALPPPSSASATDAMEIVFRPDACVWDGQFANNAWLQELPSPIMKLTWGNAALMAPATAARLGVTDEDVVELRVRGRRVDAPVLIVPGHAERSVTVHLGYGRWRAGRVGTGVGFNAYRVRPSDAPWYATALEVRRTGRKHALARTQRHHLMHGRELVRSLTLAELRAPGGEPSAHLAPPLSLYPEYRYPGYAWGMAIDLTRCIGCSACVVACQAENNIPVVGREQILVGREMHWLRVDTYFSGEPAAPEVYSMPVPCMHCEKAPCEVVCPVAATVHSAEGLNDMVYNRCVGTRYCSNNCPYKVRRFNFFDYAGAGESPYRLRANPDVTIRSRGVMEKCTYCVQRINAVRIDAERQGRRIPDGAVRTACQQACPTQAISFGDISDRTTRVAEVKRGPLNYALLAELNTQPRTTYLAAVRNPLGEA